MKKENSSVAVYMKIRRYMLNFVEQAGGAFQSGTDDSGAQPPVRRQQAYGQQSDENADG